MFNPFQARDTHSLTDMEISWYTIVKRIGLKVIIPFSVNNKVLSISIETSLSIYIFTLKISSSMYVCVCIKMRQKTEKMIETLAYGYSSNSTQQSYPMNTNVPGFRWFLKMFASLFFGWK